MSHREREIVPDGRTNERKDALSLNFFICSEYRTCECQHRTREYVRGCTVQGGWTDKEKQLASNHTVANCSNFAFYSALYGQPVQIHKKGGDMFPLWSLADKMSSTVHHMLNFVYKFLRSTSQQGITVI